MSTSSRPARRFHIIDGDGPVAAQDRGAVLALGNFDGVHRGHQTLLQVARDRAAALGTAAGVMTFEPHPRVFFRPDIPHFTLTPRPRQIELFEAFGLDLAVVLAFDKALAAMTADAFVDDILVGRFAVGHVVVGYDFSFGRDRGGKPEAMRAMGAAKGFGVTVVPPVGNGGQVFSSSAVRGHLAQGDVDGANIALGHRWRVTGTVVGGAKRGTGLGFPTANVVLPAGTSLAHGIYAVWVEVGGKRHMGAAYFGTRPQFDNGAALLETFLIDFDGDLYGQDIAVIFVDFVRRDGVFTDLEALKAQMAADCARAVSILQRTASTDPLAGLPLADA